MVALRERARLANTSKGTHLAYQFKTEIIFARDLKSLPAPAVAANVTDRLTNSDIVLTPVQYKRLCLWLLFYFAGAMQRILAVNHLVRASRQWSKLDATVLSICVIRNTLNANLQKNLCCVEIIA